RSGGVGRRACKRDPDRSRARRVGPPARRPTVDRGRRAVGGSLAVTKSLVVVESPTKVKTIQKYLDSKFIVKASMGHVRDLPKSQLGVDPKKNFKPKYVISPTKKKILDELKKAAEKADRKSTRLNSS